MTQEWNTSTYDLPVPGDGVDGYLADLKRGVNTGTTHYYGTADPSSGASWGAAQLGVIWFDSGNALLGAGDGLGLTVKRWEITAAGPTYGWRTISARFYTALEPNVLALNLADQSTTAFTDLDLTASTSSVAIAVLLQVEVQDSGTPAAGVYAELRYNGTTTDARSRRIYPQVANIPVMQQFVVECDPGQTIEYAINASGAGTFDLRIDVLGYFERA